MRIHLKTDLRSEWCLFQRTAELNTKSITAVRIQSNDTFVLLCSNGGFRCPGESSTCLIVMVDFVFAIPFTNSNLCVHGYKKPMFA